MSKCRGCGKPATKQIHDIPVCDTCYNIDLNVNILATMHLQEQREAKV